MFDMCEFVEQIKSVHFYERVLDIAYINKDVSLGFVHFRLSEIYKYLHTKKTNETPYVQIKRMLRILIKLPQ